jgi:hypothetical protein
MVEYASIDDLVKQISPNDRACLREIQKRHSAIMLCELIQRFRANPFTETKHDTADSISDLVKRIPPDTRIRIEEIRERNPALMLLELTQRFAANPFTEVKADNATPLVAAPNAASHGEAKAELLRRAPSEPQVGLPAVPSDERQPAREGLGL